MQVRIATWNLHSCIGTDGRLDPARIGDELEGLDADWIALQEVDGRKPAVDGLDQLGYLSERAGMQAIAGPNLHDERGAYGNGLLTRWPALREDRIDLSVPGREPRGAIDATFDVGGRPVRILVTHLGLGRAERRRQIGILRREVAGPAEAVLLAGDLNEWRPERRPSGLFPEPFPFVTRARTFPSQAPILPLDRVLATPRPTSATIRVAGGGAAKRASDHRLLIVDLVWETLGDER